MTTAYVSRDFGRGEFSKNEGLITELFVTSCSSLGSKRGFAHPSILFPLPQYNVSAMLLSLMLFRSPTFYNGFYFGDPPYFSG